MTSSREAPRPSDLNRLVDFLTWQGVDDQPMQWISVYEALLEERFSALVNADGDNAMLAEGLTLLEPAARRQFLRSPRIAEHLLSSEIDAASAGPVAASTLMATLAEEGVISCLDAPVWSARGDRRLGLRGAPVAAEPARRLGRTGAVVDTCSPLQRMDDMPYPALPLGRADAEVARRKLEAALEHLQNTCDAIGSFWTEIVDIVVLRGMMPISPGLISTTMERTPRSMRLINVHLRQTGIDLLADGLLHEAIHSLVFMFEHSVVGLIPDRTLVGRICVRSPWSRRDLSLLSYVHACIVWYGLYWYWQLAQRSRCLVVVERAKRQCKIAKDGFHHRPVSNGLQSLSNRVAPECFKLLSSLEERVLST